MDMKELSVFCLYCQKENKALDTLPLVSGGGQLRSFLFAE